MEDYKKLYEIYKNKYETALKTAESLLSQKNFPWCDDDVRGIFPELRELDDEKIRKTLIHQFTTLGPSWDKWGGLKRQDIIAWLEKQKPSQQMIAGAAKEAIFSEQTLANKVEPKFKVGDWIVKQYLSTPFVIVDIKNDSYILNDIEGKKYEETIDFAHKVYHLWTIEDANDGDVLAAHECYVIFKEIDGLNIKCHCTYHYMGFNPSFHVDTLQNKDAFYPATKEQRDLLLQKMKEAGYEWDAEEKELKKIKQNPLELSDEDDKWAEEIRLAIRFYSNDEQFVERLTNWFDNHVQQKQKWSEDDEKNFSSLCEFFTAFSDKHYRAYGRKEEMEKWLFHRFRNYPPRQEEWNEEDKERLDSIKDALRHYNYKSGVIKHKDVEWLEELPNRANLKTKQEWSKEDEASIKSNIINYINFVHEDDDEKETWINWLEKQKEPQVKVVAPKFRAGDLVRSKVNPSITYKVLEVDIINELGNPDYKVEIFEDGKPYIKEHNIQKIEVSRLDKWGELVEQKQWSEEDDDMVKETIYFINEFQHSDRCKDENGMQNSVTCENWLKTLKDKVLQQPKQEWSEEDETVKVSFPMLKEMLAKTYNLAFNNGLSVGKNEAEKYWKEKIDEETNKTEADNDRYWKNRIRGYCNHRWKVIPNPISDYDDYVCEICGERK